MNQPPKRRWSFSLRTIFVVVTLAAFCATAWRAYPRSVRGKLYLLRPGVTQAQVIERLGEPQDRYNSDYLYPDGFHDPYVVEFGPDGTFTGIIR